MSATPTLTGAPAPTSTSPDQLEALEPKRVGRKGRLRKAERGSAFFVPLAAFLATGWLLVLHYHSVYQDALSRLANAYYIFYGQDPHLAAVGFVWNPLPSFVDAPLLLFKGIWPPLATDAFASNITSALLMAGAAYQVYRFCEDLGVRRLTRWGLWLCFVGNPMIFFYGANGMSEALFIFTLVFTARYLAQWLATGRTRPLVLSGLMLGTAYLARNEAVASAAAAGVVVVVATYLRTAGIRRIRRMAALTDGTLFLVPFIAAFSGWALASWIVVGHPFEQISSQYGNAALIKAGGAANAISSAARLKYALHGAQAIAPLLIAAAILSLLKGWRARDARVLAPLSILGSVVLFEIAAYTTNQIFPWFRYYVYGVPAIVLLCACLAAPPYPGRRIVVIDLRAGRDFAREGPSILLKANVGAGWMGLLAVALAAPGILTTAHTLGTPGGLGGSDRIQFNYILWPHAADSRTTGIPKIYNSAATEAKVLDRMHLMPGSLVVDNADSCIPNLILDSKHPEQFGIPNDVGYIERLGSPYDFGIRYLLVPDPAVAGAIDSLDREWPTLYRDGAGIATLAGQLNWAGCPTFRLYKVIPRPA